MLKQFLAAVALTGFVAAGTASAQPGPGFMHHGDGLMRVLKSLNLSDAQQTKIHDIFESAHTQMEPLRQQLETLHKQMESGVVSGQTASQLGTIEQQEESVESQLHQLHLNITLQVRDVLTSQQLSQAASTWSQLDALDQQRHAILQGNGSAPSAP